MSPGGPPPSARAQTKHASDKPRSSSTPGRATRSSSPPRGRTVGPGGFGRGRTPASSPWRPPFFEGGWKPADPALCRGLDIPGGARHFRHAGRGLRLWVGAPLGRGISKLRAVPVGQSSSRGTSWRKRLRLALEADLVICLYNPISPRPAPLASSGRAFEIGSGRSGRPGRGAPPFPKFFSSPAPFGPPGRRLAITTTSAEAPRRGGRTWRHWSSSAPPTTHRENRNAPGGRAAMGASTAAASYGGAGISAAPATAGASSGVPATGLSPPFEGRGGARDLSYQKQASRAAGRRRGSARWAAAPGILGDEHVDALVLPSARSSALVGRAGRWRSRRRVGGYCRPSPRQRCHRRGRNVAHEIGVLRSGPAKGGELGAGPNREENPARRPRPPAPRPSGALAKCRPRPVHRGAGVRGAVVDPGAGRPLAGAPRERHERHGGDPAGLRGGCAGTSARAKGVSTSRSNGNGPLRAPRGGGPASPADSAAEAADAHR